MFQAITSPRVCRRPGGFLLRTCAALILSLAGSRGAGAQDQPPSADPASLGGHVVDARTGAPLAGVTILLALATGETPREASAVTDPEGRFLLVDLPPGDHVIRIRVGGRGTEPRTIQLRESHHTEISVSVSQGDGGVAGGIPVAQLPPLEVEIEGEARPGKLRAFYDRRERGHGYFISGPEIRERSPFRTSDLVRGVPGLIITRDPGGRHGLRVGRSGRCPIEYFVDGTPAPGLSIDDIPPGDIDGLEIYRGASEVPIQYRRATTCAAILIWTRDPGGP